MLKIRTGHRWQYGACAFHTGYQGLQTHTPTVCNTYCFSTATTVARKHLHVKLYVHCRPC